MMKWGLFAILIVGMMSAGCATPRIAAHIGADIGSSFQAAAATGELSAEESIRSWPYVSGQIRGLYADDFATDMPIKVQNIMSRLDGLAVKDTLSLEEKGLIIGHYVRLEALALEIGWRKYGISIYELIMKVIGG